jgi:putative ABC transport system ATP-binding protein
MLEIKNASLKVGGTDLFCGLSFAVDDGGMVCVMGPSGSGKTTLLRTLLGFRPLDGGHVSIDGELLTPSSAEEFRKIMAYVPQEVALPTEWVADMVAMLFSLKIKFIPYLRQAFRRSRTIFFPTRSYLFPRLCLMNT